MSDLALRLRRTVATLLAIGRAGARAAVPARARGPVARRLRPRIRRTTAMLESPYWYELGHRYLRHGRERAAESFIAAFERGSMLLLTSLQMHLSTARGEMGKPDNVRRMRELAAAEPNSWAKQFAVGAFLLDHGHLDEGRATVRRGHEILLRPDSSPLLPESGDPRGRTPDFLIVGPQKSGTTSLYALLSEHPQVVPAPRKELHFWGHRHDRSLAHYEAYFPALRPGFVTGEATPTYLHLAEAVEGVATHCPSTRIIAMRREPVARTYSHYQMRCRVGEETRTFERAVDDELELLGATAPIWSAPEVTRTMCPFLLGSAILPYVKRWVDAVGAERLLIVESAALSRRRQATVDAVHGFLGLPPSSVEAVENRGVFGYDPIPESVAARLRAWFAPHEEALDAFLAGHPNVVRLGDG